MSFYNPYPPQQMYAPPMQDQLAQFRQPYLYQNQNTQTQQQQSGMVWVKNRAEAEAYPVAPYTAIALWDMDSPIVYKKETDASGKPTIRTFNLVEVTEVPQQTNVPAVEFVTRKEFRDFVDSLNAQGVGKFTKKEEFANE